jgi:SAM-dependent methyltransferase
MTLAGPDEVVKYDDVAASSSHASLLKGYHHFRRLTAIRNVLESLGPDIRVLDVGCGDGNQSAFYWPDRELVGLDLSVRRLQRSVGSRHGVLQPLVGSTYQLPLKSGTFDAVVCSQLIEHLHHPEQALGEIVRVLKPGAHLILDTPSRSNVVDAALRLIGRDSPWGLHIDSTHVAFYNMEEIVAMINGAGLDVCAIEGAPRLRYDLPKLKRWTWRRGGWWIYRLADGVLGAIPVIRRWGAIQLFVARKA